MKPTKIDIPEELKSDVPHTTWGKILSATPVVMAVVATMLAGLSSSEMTRAQYDRSLAAQQQSKAGDQWSFFQAKRLRGALQENTLDVLQATSPVAGLNSGSLKDLAGGLTGEENRQQLTKLMESPDGQRAITLLEKGEMPALPPATPIPPGIQEALRAMHSPSGEPELPALLARIKPEAVEEAVRHAREQAQAFDALTGPLNQVIDQAGTLLRPSNDSGLPPDHPAGKQFTQARLRFAALRYEAEARLNQGIANLYELQVRLSNLSAERHHVRSQRFFYGMLAAQAGVIISTFAMAARKRNVLWSIAAAAGLIAIAFAVYVYLYV